MSGRPARVIYERFYCNHGFTALARESVSETGKTCATGATREDDTSDPSHFSRKSHESPTHNDSRFTRNALSD